MLEVHRCSSVEWKPSPVIALATSPDESQVAAARGDGTLEIWLVSPGSVGWHCQLTIHGSSDSRVSSLVWDRSGRLLSTSLDGSVYEWDLFDLTQKTVLDSIGVSLWQIAAEPINTSDSIHTQNGHVYNETNRTESDEEDNNSDDDIELHEESTTQKTRLAIACDDGCVRIYSLSKESTNLTYVKTLPRVSGRTLSVTWSPDASRIYSGSSDGLIRCWDANLGHEVYRITVGLGGVQSGSELCIWSLLALRNDNLVSGDSSGSVQFWDSKFGTLINAHSLHKGDVNALAASPTHTRVFAADSDGQVILYKLSVSDEAMKKWVYVCSVKAHTHDIRALTIAIPICREDLLPDEKIKRARGKEKPQEFSYHKWAHLGVPMLISSGDDTKIFAYSAKEFTKFSPHDITPAPQKPPMQLIPISSFNQTPLLLIQSSTHIDICNVKVKPMGPGPSNTQLVVLTKVKSTKKIICSSISSTGKFFAYSDHKKPKLFELELKGKKGKNVWSIVKRNLSSKLPFAHSLIFSSDSSRLILAGQDRRIYVVDIESSEVVKIFIPSRKEVNEDLTPGEPPITRMFTSNDGQWLACVNCFGDVYIFNLETQRQHWFISRLDGASVTAGGFTPKNSNVLIISTSSNQVYAFDIEAKQLGEWSMKHTFSLPKRYQEFPGDVNGLSFPPSSTSSSVTIYSPRAMCFIDFGMPVEGEGDDGALKKLQIVSGKLKRKLKDYDNNKKNFEFRGFKDPVLFVGHLSKNSILVIDKPWMRVVESFEAKPVHRHIYGT